jgi:hypothetical protein
MIKTKLRSTALYGLLIAVMAGGLTAPARADYPDRPVHVIVPVAAGGGVDVMARLLAQRLGERLHQSFVVENKPGAAGVIGSKYVIAAPADGYTLLYTPSSLSLAVVVHQTPPYDVSKDFTPIINVAISPYVPGVNPSLPEHNLKEFIAYAKANPGRQESILVFDAAPMSINFSEVSALRTKVAEGQENPLSIIFFAKPYEVQKYLSETNHMWDGFWFLANGKLWNGLPADGPLKACVETKVIAVSPATSSGDDDEAQLTRSI